VIKTVPASGAKIRKGDEVTLIVSLGPELVRIPSVTGQDANAARLALQRAGFKVTVKRANDDQVPKGDVIDQNPNAGQKIQKGSPVTITVSLGPELVKVPNVAGQDSATAAATLQSLGFDVTTTEEFSTTVAKGKAIGTDPPAEKQIPKGSAVTLVVSKGPKTFPMPNVIGKDADQAKAQLETLGLTVKEVQVPGSIGNKVVGQSPDPGTTVHQGQEVTIYVGG
jgi:serine/threonine-protein kinase